MARSTSSMNQWFWGGRLSLDFVATVRFRHHQPIELLEQPADLADWLLAAGLTATRVHVSVGQLKQARVLREATYRLATAARTGHRWARSDIAAVNDHSAIAPPVPVLTAHKERWIHPADARSLFSLVARDAIDLLGGEVAHKIRECAAEHCTRLFVDTSRSRTRRWCSMEQCGNRAKVTAYRDRRT